MDDKATKRGGGAVVALGLVAVFVLLLMLYVLSVGPAVWLVENELLNRPVAAAFYWPLEWIAIKVPVVGPILNRYVDWWAPNTVTEPVAPPLSAPTAPAPAAPPAPLPATATPE